MRAESQRVAAARWRRSATSGSNSPAHAVEGLHLLRTQDAVVGGRLAEDGLRPGAQSRVAPSDGDRRECAGPGARLVAGHPQGAFDVVHDRLAAGSQRPDPAQLGPGQQRPDAPGAQHEPVHRRIAGPPLRVHRGEHGGARAGQVPEHPGVLPHRLRVAPVAATQLLGVAGARAPGDQPRDPVAPPSQEPLAQHRSPAAQIARLLARQAGPVVDAHDTLHALRGARKLLRGLQRTAQTLVAGDDLEHGRARQHRQVVHHAGAQTRDEPAVALGDDGRGMHGVAQRDGDAAGAGQRGPPDEVGDEIRARVQGQRQLEARGVEPFEPVQEVRVVSHAGQTTPAHGRAPPRRRRPAVRGDDVA